MVNSIDMRDAFFTSLYDVIKEDKNVYLLTADHGAFGVDKIRADFPNQYLNVGIAEQNVINVAAGLALTGKIVYVYGITNFIILRCLEQINIDIASMNLHVNIVSVGAGFTYCTDGPTHHGTQDIAIMSAIPNFRIYNCSDVINTMAFAKLGYTESGPKYFRIEKGIFPDLYTTESFLYEDGIAQIHAGDRYAIISSGSMVHKAVAMYYDYRKRIVDVDYGDVRIGVYDVYRLKPFPVEMFVAFVRHYKKLFILEDNVANGGLADKVCSALVDCGVYIPTIKWNVGDKFCFKYSTDRDWVERQAIGECLL
ncbi:MAG: hypothetical protein KKC55_14700 [Gammaproteobacteria bacterium]|nr:hypothetical protein [Gammaproteobacteria bacterium]